MEIGDEKMSKNQRKLTKKEQKRLELIYQEREKLETEGYEYSEKLFGGLFVNIVSILVMLPYAALMVGLFAFFNLSDESPMESFRLRHFDFFPSLSVFCLAYTGGVIVMMIIHELIHGICYASSVSGGWKSVEFGFNTAAVAPYCVCLEPLTKKAYIITMLMPTVILGFIPCIIGSVIGKSFVFLLGFTLVFGGGGDFLMTYNLLTVKTNGFDAVFIDHPTEIGSMIFMRKQGS